MSGPCFQMEDGSLLHFDRNGNRRFSDRSVSVSQQAVAIRFTDGRIRQFRDEAHLAWEFEKLEKRVIELECAASTDRLAAILAGVKPVQGV